MSSNCITDTSKACLKTFCVVNPQISPPDPETRAIVPHRDFVTSVLSSIQPNSSFTNHESLPSITQLFSTLRNAFPQYSNTFLTDEIRLSEYSHLSNSNHVCLDYNGNGLFSYSQLQKHGSFKYNHDTYNPIAEIASSSSSSSFKISGAPFFDISYKMVNLDSYLSQQSEFESAIRKRIMRYMNLSEDDYTLVFTANQASAMKLVARCYPFQSNPNLLTVYDHENESVQTMINSAKRKGARVLSATFSWPNFRVEFKKLTKLLIGKSKTENRGLFVFPLQSRITGSRYSHQWMNLARDSGWHVLLDACALGTKDMDTLGLSIFQPDFITSSFYKVFGENPSGFCCLFIKKSSLSNFKNSDKSMGVISLIPPQKGHFRKFPSSSEIQEANENHESVECHGLDQADELSLILISSRARILINWLVNALLSLRHPGNGLPLVIIYGPKIKLDRGPALAFNVYDWKGEKIDPIMVQKLADRNNISVNRGFLKNLCFSKDFIEAKEHVLERRKSLQDLIKPLEVRKNKKGKRDSGIEVVSVCIGMLSNFEDVYRLWEFVSKFLDADFVEKERWRYTALNRTPVEV